MNEEFVTKAEHTEFARRIEEEDKRQNARLAKLEESVEQIAELTVSVKELATNMGHMVREQESQGKKLDAIESRDGDKWRKAVSYVLTAIGGAILAYLLAKVGLNI